MGFIIPSCDYQHFYLEQNRIEFGMSSSDKYEAFTLYLCILLSKYVYIGIYLEHLLCSLYMCNKETRHVKERIRSPIKLCMLHWWL